jgi:hypothetical protein
MPRNACRKDFLLQASHLPLVTYLALTDVQMTIMAPTHKLVLVGEGVFMSQYSISGAANLETAKYNKYHGAGQLGLLSFSPCPVSLLTVSTRYAPLLS